MSTSNLTVRRRDARLKYLLLGVFMGVFLFVFMMQYYKGDNNADAASFAGFDPGYIISDYQMGNYNSMSEADIQAWLTAMNPCDNRDYGYFQRLSANVKYTWHWDNGHFVCLSEERFGDNDNEIGFHYGESAAHIIWQAAQDYRINPQVLLVLLQKETGLITDRIPNNSDYRKATGYGCPDTAACSSKYYGFKNQIRNAASLYRYVLDNGSRYYPIGNNFVQYNPNAGCGGTVVNIRNRATSSLYQYTPYQPNAAALAAGYGTGDLCSAYGNRNFYSYFEDWFGGVTRDHALIPSSDNIVEGTYTLRSALNENKALDVSGGVANARSGTNIQLYDSNGTEAQRWRIQSNGDGTYTVINPATGKVLDVAAGSRVDGGNIQLYDSNGTCAQRWQIAKSADGVGYVFYSMCSGKTIDVAGASVSNGTNIQIYAPNNTRAQKWVLSPVRALSDGEYEMTTALSNNMSVDITAGISRAFNGTNIQVYERNKSDAQKWRVTYGSDGYYSITNPATGMLLSVNDSNAANYSNVLLLKNKADCTQKWQIVGLPGNTYGVYSACRGLALDVAGGVAGNGINIQVYPSNKSKAQEWNFVSSGGGGIEGTYTLRSALNENKALDVSGGVANARNGTNIQLYDSNGTEAQRWRIQSNGDGTYTVINPATGKVLDVAAGSRVDGGNIQLYDSNGTCAQRWQIAKSADGVGYVFYSMCSGKTIDVAGASVSNGTNIQIYAPNNTRAQKWVLR